MSVVPCFRFMLKAIAAGVLFTLAHGAIAQDPPPPAPTTEQTTATAVAAATAAVAAVRPDLNAPKPFKEIIKGSTEMKGFFTLHQKDEKVWIEIKPEQLDQPFFFSVNIPNSVGERGLYASQMGTSHMVVFHKIGNQIQLLAKNTRYTAAPGTPQALAVSQAFSDSLLASATVQSAPHPPTPCCSATYRVTRPASIPPTAWRFQSTRATPVLPRCGLTNRCPGFTSTRIFPCRKFPRRR
jgi:hypothetical protein